MAGEFEYETGMRVVIRHVDTSDLVRGMEFALKRLVPPRGIAHVLGGGGFFPLYEIVAWAGGLADRLEKEKRTPPPGLEGIYYVRNIVLHQGADILTAVGKPGTTLDEVLGGSPAVPGQYEWKWPPRDQLPPPRSQRGGSDYDENLAGREVAVTLQTVCDALRRD